MRRQVLEEPFNISGKLFKILFLVLTADIKVTQEILGTHFLVDPQTGGVELEPQTRLGQELGEV